MLNVKRCKIIFILIETLQVIFLLIFFQHKVVLTYYVLSIIGIVHCVSNVLLLKFICKLPIVSIPNMFAFFSFVFHCGQIIKIGFSIEGTVPLPIENYASMSEIIDSFFFYLFSQVVFFCTVALIERHDDADRRSVLIKWRNKSSFGVSKYGMILMGIGIIPRLYIDVLSLIRASINGYEGVYSIYFPQAIQSIAFFCDAGLILLLFGNKNTKSEGIIFWGTILYKCIMMTSGGRQDKVAFLLIWIYIYYFVINKISFKRLFFLGCLCVAGLWFINSIGSIRTENTTGIAETINFLKSGTMNNVLGDTLGEFGSAFATLEIAYKHTPSSIQYGYGRTFLAGCLSVVPLLVNQIPVLSETVIFLTQLPKNITFAMGGSYLGELYYNFSWFGILGSVVLGVFITRLHNGIVNNNDMSSDLYKAWCSILSTAMLLYVRGYFTDMMQKLVWTYFVIYLVYLYMRKKNNIVQVGEKSI